ncbi:hypothetical protein C5U48_00655 [Mycolicibacter virginiensis]|uniref:PPE-PPW subfamily C-terminal domain-containing protein n=1 Tax=Mycolicibacter virginiensis TaxID=1795032 RepID=A0A9X7P0I3_9MYCO|nr:hypothetical protein C5U48_00655 [Mycolicibacter virginiensis]
MAPPTLAPAATVAGGPALPPPFTGAETAFVPYLVGAGPANGARMQARASTPAQDQRRDAAEAAATSTTPASQLRRRRQRKALTDPGNRYEYLDSADALAAEHGAGQVGFSGTVSHETNSAVTGLTTLTASATGPSIPMLPRTWEAPEQRDQLD